MEPITNEEAAALEHCDRLPPTFIVGACVECGNCCAYYECTYFNDGCMVHANKPAACRTYPQSRQEINLVQCQGFKSLRG